MKYKVLFVASWYPNKFHPIEGIFIKKHAEAVSLYCEVAILYLKPTDKVSNMEIDIQLENGIKVIRIYYRPTKVPIIGKIVNLYKYFISAIKALKILEKQFGRPDVTHVNVIFPAGLIALILYYTKGIPYIVTEHYTGFKPDEFNRLGFFKKFLIRFIAKKSKIITTVSEKLKLYMQQDGLNNSYSIVENVVEVSKFKEILKEKEVNNIFSKNKKIKKKIAHVSLLDDSKKNVSGILYALKEVLEIRDDFELHIVGDGKDRQKLEDIASNLNLLNKYVYFHGIMENEKVYKFLFDADFLIINSNRETFSVVAAESLAAGTPVITTKCGGPEEFINSKVGVLIEPGNILQLKDSIIYMLNHCDEYKKEELMNYAKEKFSPEVIGKKFFEIYKKILKKD